MNVAISTTFFPMAVNNIGNVVHCHLAAMNNKNGDERRRKSKGGYMLQAHNLELFFNSLANGL